MNTINSFKGYGKVDALEQQAFRQKTRKRLIILIISSIVLVAVIIGAVIGIVAQKDKNNDSSSAPATQVTPASSLKALCSVTQYPGSCFSSISSTESSNVTTDPEILFKLSLQVALNELSKLQDYPSKLKEKTKDPQVIQALNVCEEVFGDALDYVNDSLSSMQVGDGEKLLSMNKIQDLKTWLSTSITDQDTCLDALQELNATHYGNSNVLNELRSAMQNSTEFASNCLAIGSKILGLLDMFDIPVHRRLLSDHADSHLSFPSWVGAGDRRLLEEVKPKPDATVAQDGTGDYKTIGAAVAAVPKKSPKRFVIYIKKGTYKENVILDRNKWNVMMYGDGKTATMVSGGKNFVDGTPTFATATVAVDGKGFIAKDMTFINIAGPEKLQAVAFRSGSDKSVFYQCAFDAYQDTLYAYSNRQFYRDCDITGTIDFIFGNAAVVFQNCNIMPRQPLPYQFNTITAQGKTDPNQNTGISIQNCTLMPFGGNLTAKTYLGRPWKDFSTTVIMQSTIGPFLNPLGWTEWVSGVEPPKSIFYGEYLNVGQGSNKSGRVKWAGYRPNLTVDEAGKFTVGNFIQGKKWLTDAKVQFQESL